MRYEYLCQQQNNMDENEFEKLFLKNTIFKNKGTLDLSYVPDKIFCRDKAIKTLIFNYGRIFEGREQPNINCLILGKKGVGKTVTAKFFGKLFRNIANEKDVKVFVEYYNCINFHSKTKIFRDLLAKLTRGSGRGFADDVTLKLIIKQLIQVQRYMLLIFDEVPQLKNDEILALLSVKDTFGSQDAIISILMIAEEKEWSTIENEKILSGINEKILLLPYNFEESTQIIKYRSDLAFQKGVFCNDLLNLIGKITAIHQSMRCGIHILRKSGNQAEVKGLDEITIPMIHEASYEFKLDIITKLKEQELFTLLGITRALIYRKQPFTLVDDAYEEYTKLCETHLVDVHVKISFRKYIRHLSKLSIVDTNVVKIKEVKRGRYLEITLSDISPKKLEEDLRIIIKHQSKKD